VPLGLILHPSYRIRDGCPVIRLVGRLEHDVAFLVEDDRFRPYFFVAKDEAGPLAGTPGVDLRETNLCDMAGRKVVEVVAQVPGDVPPLRESLERTGGCALEADIRFAYRYLIDRGIRTGVSIEGKAEAVRPGLVRFRNPELRPADCRPPLRTISIDLETTPDASEIYSIALAGRDVAEVHLVGRAPVAGAQVHPDERRLLAAATERIHELDPDILTGWNVVDFDLRTWVRRARALGLTARLGRVAGAVAFQRDPRFTRQTRADVPGRMVLDGIALVRDALRLEDYRLETVAQAVLGRGKLLDPEAPDAAAEITRLYREDPAALVAYNLEDARLVLDILEHEGLLDLTLERSLMSGMQLDRVGASIASFDRVYLPELRRRGVVAPSVHADRKTAQVKGGALLEPRPGVFSNVAVFDFKSLYPSLIRTFNLDPLAHARAADSEDAIEAPGGARFARGDAILPTVIEHFMERREDAKLRGDRHADQAIKIMMNALFGVLGAGSCRFFDPDVANAITGFGQQTLRWTREAFEEEGVHVLYGDTDSVFVQLESGAPPETARAVAEELRGRVERRIDERVRDEYRVEPRLELEFERLFERFFLPRVRGGKSGSKKRYAGWTRGELVIVGLESVRRDWPAIARRLQQGMLTRLFRDEDVLPFVRSLVTGVVAGEFDAELVYVKRIRKGSVERYTATTPPHVQAARKAGGRVGPVVRYMITLNGPEPVLPGRALPKAIDRRHYVEHVLRPIADAILPHVDSSFAEAIGQPRQLSLL
jgi:DNA polymerase-2